MADTTQPFADLYWSAPDGVRLHAHDWRGDEAGDGALPPLVCLPGLTRNARDFDAPAARLSPRRRVIAVSLRGRGGSGKAPPETYVPRTYVADVLALLDQIDAHKVAVIGTSLGGLVAMMLAAAAPGRIAGVALNDVGPRLEPVGMGRIRAQLGRPNVWPTWMHAARAVADGLRDVYPDWGLLDWLAMAKRLYRLNSAGRIVADFDGAIAEAFRLPAPDPAPDPWPLLDALAGLPVLLVRGERSEVLGVATATRMVAAVPGATLATVPRVGHAPTLTEPVAAAAIDRWLENVT